MFLDMIRYRCKLVFSDMSCPIILHMEGIDCYILKLSTMEPLMHLSMPDLLNPFPPVHSTIVQATTNWRLRTLVRYDEVTWYSGPRRDWPSLPVLQDILSNIDCTEDFHAFAYTCKSWLVVSSLYPRPLLLDPLATPTWLFVTPGGRLNNAIGNFRLFPTRRIEQSTLIGGSTKFLIFMENSLCYIINIHTGERKELHVPFCGVQRGVLSAPPESESSNILLVTATSILCKSVNGSDQWRVTDFGDIHVGAVDDIVFVGDTAYLIDKRSRLFIITLVPEISFCHLGDFEVFAPRRHSEWESGFGRRLRPGLRPTSPKLVCNKNWLLEFRGELVRIFQMCSALDDTDVYSRFFMARIGPDVWHNFFKNKSEKAGLYFPSHKFPAEAWIEMASADLGDACVFLSSGNAASFVSEKPGRWGLKSGQVLTCRPDVFPWLSFDFKWVREGDVLPENIQWPCPVFMDSDFSFAASEELDHRILFDKAAEPTALNLDSTASSSCTLPSEAREISCLEEAK